MMFSMKSIQSFNMEYLEKQVETIMKMNETNKYLIIKKHMGMIVFKTRINVRQLRKTKKIWEDLVYSPRTYLLIQCLGDLKYLLILVQQANRVQGFRLIILTNLRSVIGETLLAEEIQIVAHSCLN